MGDDWHVYVIECADGSFYTGIATDVQKRLNQHAAGGPRAAKYVKTRRPFSLRLVRSAGARGTALRLEAKIKKLARWEKEVLLEDENALDVLVDECSE